MSVIWSGVTEEGAVVPVQVTAEGKVVAVGDGPEGEYLKLTGGNLTGDLTVNNQITLATDGSATFGPENVGTFFNVSCDKGGINSAIIENTNANSYGVRFTGGGATSTNYVADFRKQDNTSVLKLNGDGSATFASNVVSGGDPSLAANHGIKMTPAGSLIATGADSAITMYIPGDTTAKTVIYANGSAKFAGSRCGFTSAGELFFTSRNERYKLIVSNGLCQAEPYTRQMELKEKAEQFISEKRETKPSDPSDPSDPQSEVTTDNDNA